MDETGATSAVERMAAVANHARIGDMLFSELDEWASESGLTKDERARPLRTFQRTSAIPPARSVAPA